jgi:hypothetical protein
MSNRLIESVCVVLVSGLMLGGCKAQREQQVIVLPQEPDRSAFSAPSQYASAAIDAAGGLDAWTTTKQLQLDCVVTFFRPDGAFYLTEQSFNIYPWSNSLEISATEPQGAFAWRLSEGQFEVLQGADQVKDLPMAVASRCFAEAILEIITAPARLLEDSPEFARESAAVKIHGQWYHPIKRKGATEAVFYQDRDNSVVDMIELACKAGNKSLTVRGYDYKKVEKGGPAVPTKIEIFSASSGAGAENRLVKIDCRRFVRTR